MTKTLNNVFSIFPRNTAPFRASSFPCRFSLNFTFTIHRLPGESSSTSKNKNFVLICLSRYGQGMIWGEFSCANTTINELLKNLFCNSRGGFFTTIAKGRLNNFFAIHYSLGPGTIPPRSPRPWNTKTLLLAPCGTLPRLSDPWRQNPFPFMC